MTVEANCELKPLSYQWYRVEPVTEEFVGWIEENYFMIDGATEPSYTVQNAYESGEYCCKVTDSLGNPVEVRFYLTVGNNFSAKARNGQTSFDVNPGETVEMTVEVDTDAELSYQWYEEISVVDDKSNGREWKTILIEEATESSYTINADRSQSLFCKVSDRLGNKQFVWFNVNVESQLEAHAKDYQKQITVNPGQSVRMEVEASCDAALRYQWYEQFEQYEPEGYVLLTAKRIDGATESSYAIDAVNTRKLFMCRVYDPYGNYQEVDFSLRVESNLETHAKDNRQSFTVAPGTPVEMVVEASCDKNPLRYQWYEQLYSYDSVGDEIVTTKRIKGATESRYSTDKTYNKKYYFCYVTDPYGNVAEVGFDLQIETHFEAHAKDGQTSIPLDYGQSAVLTVEASCDKELQYRWFEMVLVDDGGEFVCHRRKQIVGATESSYTTDSESTSTEYFCRVSDSYGHSQDVYFYLQINTNLEAYAKGNQSSINLDYDQPAELTVEANCDLPLTYQWYEKVRVYNSATSWYFRTNQILGATGNSYTRESNSPATEYYCRVMDPYGNRQNVYFYLQLNTNLQVHAKDDLNRMSVTPGESVEMTVEASCDTDLIFQWSESVHHTDADGNQYVSEESINGATGKSYTAEAVNENAEYICHVRDGFGNRETVWFYLSVDQSNA